MVAVRVDEQHMPLVSLCELAQYSKSAAGGQAVLGGVPAKNPAGVPAGVETLCHVWHTMHTPRTGGTLGRQKCARVRRTAVCRHVRARARVARGKSASEARKGGGSAHGVAFGPWGV